MNITVLQLVAICKTQLYVSTLYVGYHQVIQRTFKMIIQYVLFKTRSRPPFKITTHIV